jgi:hypothetical protein
VSTLGLHFLTVASCCASCTFVEAAAWIQYVAHPLPFLAAASWCISCHCIVLRMPLPRSGLAKRVDNVYVRASLN